MKLTKKYINGLGCGSLDNQSISRDWEELRGENFDGYNIHEAMECSECCKIVIGQGYGEEQHKYIDENSGCEGYLHSEGPMMNYSYPIHIYPEKYDTNEQDFLNECAKKIAHLPLCIVDFGNEEYELALTGGGMDFRWEICEAFILLNNLPPVAFADLPKMAGRGESEKDKMLIYACQRAFKVVADFSKRNSKNFKEKYATI